jgi:hypothetical protein
VDVHHRPDHPRADGRPVREALMNLLIIVLIVIVVIILIGGVGRL